MKVLTQKKYQDHIPCIFAQKLICVDDEFSKPIAVFRSKNAAYQVVFKEYVQNEKIL